MRKERTKHLDFIVLDILAMELALVAGFFILRQIESFPVGLTRQLGLLLIVVNISVTFFTEGYRDVLGRGYLKEMVAVCKHVAMVMVVIVVFLFLLYRKAGHYRNLLLTMAPLSIPLLYGTRLALKAFLKKRYDSIKYAKNVTVVATMARAREILRALAQPSVKVFRVVGLAVLDCDMKGQELEGIAVTANKDDMLQSICNQVTDEAFISSPADPALEQELVQELLSIGVVTHILVENQGLCGNRELESIAGMEVMTCSSKITLARRAFLKRAVDIAGGLAGLVLAGLVGVVIAPAIYIKSPGPVLFAQYRVGKNGRCFKIYKFRSMYMDAEARKQELLAGNSMQGCMFKLEDDPRIIDGIGHFIRKTSLDEFPQFYNVLKGDMSLVGTRPPTVDEVEQYEFRHKKRLCMRPGITGLWQVSGRSQITDFEEVVRLDAAYIDNWSFELDIKILLKTVWVVLHGTGAE